MSTRAAIQTMAASTRCHNAAHRGAIDTPYIDYKPLIISTLGKAPEGFLDAGGDDKNFSKRVLQ
jgi:hypothetical protein